MILLMKPDADGPGRELADAMAPAMSKIARDIRAAAPRARAAWRAGIGVSAWAARKAAETDAEASLLARATPFSRETWLKVIAAIDSRHLDREALLPLIGEAAAKTGTDPWEITLRLIGTGENGDHGAMGA